MPASADSQKTKPIYSPECVITSASVTPDDYTNIAVNNNTTLLPRNRTNTIKIERLWVNKQQRTVNIIHLGSGQEPEQEKKLN